MFTVIRSGQQKCGRQNVWSQGSDLKIIIPHSTIIIIENSWNAPGNAFCKLKWAPLHCALLGVCLEERGWGCWSNMGEPIRS